MMTQRHAIAQHETGRFGTSCRFAFLAAAQRTLRPMNLSIVGYRLQSLPFDGRQENDSRQSGRMTM